MSEPVRLTLLASFVVDEDWLQKSGLTPESAIRYAQQQAGFALSDALSYKEFVRPGSTQVIEEPPPDEAAAAEPAAEVG